MRRAGLPTLAIGPRINPYECRCRLRVNSRSPSSSRAVIPEVQPSLSRFFSRRLLPRSLGKILYFLELLLEGLRRVRVLERPGQILYVLLVGPHEHRGLLEGHVFESGNRQRRDVQRFGNLGFLAHSIHPSCLDQLFLYSCRLALSSFMFSAIRLPS